MSRFLPVLPALACVAALPVRYARAEGDEAAAPEGVNPKAVEYVLGKVRCSNPEDVVRTAFSGVCYDDPRSIHYYKHVAVETRELGDGTQCYVFEFSAASSVFRHFFALEEGKMRLLFEGAAVFLLVRKPKVNGRYLVTFGDHEVSRSGDGGLLTNRESVSFWNGREYVVAYTVVETTLISGAGAAGGRTETTVKWNPGARAQFLAAPRTWTYVVNPSDTLTRIATRFETSVSEIVEQNGIADPDRIRAGQELRFDSRKAKPPHRRPFGRREISPPGQSPGVGGSGRPIVVGGVSHHERAPGPEEPASAE